MTADSGHLFSTSLLVMSLWKLEIGHGGNIHTIENRQTLHIRALFCCCFVSSFILDHQTPNIPPSPLYSYVTLCTFLAPKLLDS